MLANSGFWYPQELYISKNINNMINQAACFIYTEHCCRPCYHTACLRTTQANHACDLQASLVRVFQAVCVLLAP